jgi:hypothetical protein
MKSKFDKTEDEIINELTRLWGEDLSLSHLDTSRFLFGEAHPYDWRIGLDKEGHRQLIFESGVSARLKGKGFSSQLVRCDEKPIPSNKVYDLRFTLLKEDVLDVFLVLCKDLIQLSARCDSPRDAVHEIINRFRLWKLMMGRGQSHEEVVKGLMGEFLMIQQLKQLGYMPGEVVQAWTGPEYTDQDFVFPAKWFEVKTCNSSSSKITISSADQLDREGEGWLYVFKLDRADRSEKGAISLSIVAADLLNSFFQSDPEATQKFQEKLMNTGLDVLVGDDSCWFLRKGFTRFAIERDFPRLTHTIKKPEIDSIRYELLLGHLDKWRK